jgi:hypothetical protein
MRTNLLTLAAVAVAALASSPALADDTATWPFDITTHGEDVHWVSPSAINNTGDFYVVTNHTTQVVVTVKYLYFNFDVDITDQIPPEYLNGTITLQGPPPIVAVNQNIVYPLPPDPPSVKAHMVIGLNAGGYGFADVTNIYFGQAKVDLGPPWGIVTVDIKAIRMVGSVTATAYMYRAGDTNCDGAVDGGDIDPFFEALADPQQYLMDLPYCSLGTVDVNGDGSADGGDIDPFFVLLGGG